MLSLCLAILCSVSVGVLIKVARQRGIEIAQSIAVNYLVAIGLCFLLLKPDFKGQTLVEIVQTNPSAYLFFALGILLPSVAVGLVLGSLNFGNILFYIQAHQAMKDDPTLVFTGMNLGVICGGTLIGALVFKEKINKINYLGVAIAIVAIICLFYWR